MYTAKVYEESASLKWENFIISVYFLSDFCVSSPIWALMGLSAALLMSV